MKLFTALLATTLLVLVVLVASELVESPESEAHIDLSQGSFEGLLGMTERVSAGVPRSNH